MASKSAGIIIVGDEILKGQVKDVNSMFIFKRLRAIGTKVRKMSVVGDDIDDIGNVVKEFSEKFDFVVTSGGIGPTHDDVTYKGVARGFNEDVVVNTHLEDYWKHIDNLEASHAMSLIPKSAKLNWVNLDKHLFNNQSGLAVTTYPVVSVSNVYILPGIPQYFESLVTSLEKKHFQSHGFSFYSGNIYLCVDEELVVVALNKTVEELKDCVFGSYPVLGNSKYRTQITVEAESGARVQAAKEFFKSLIPSCWLAQWYEEMASPVHKFLQEAEDSKLAATLSKSIKIVENAFDQYKLDELKVSFNGGKDCTALLHIVLGVKEQRKLSGTLQAVYFKPTNPFPQVEQFIQDSIKRHHIKLTTLSGPIKAELSLLVKREPELKAIFLGTRRTDPLSKDLCEFQMTDPGWPDIMRISPLLDWSYQEIWAFLRGIEAPYCSLYDEGRKQAVAPKLSEMHDDIHLL